MIINTNRARGSALAFAALSTLSLGGCGRETGTAVSGPTVVAGTTQVADLAENVAGDRAGVVGILSPASDPHEYEPRPSDAEAMIDASLVLKSGGDIDLWLDELVESSGTEAEVISLIDSVAIDGSEAGDPHWWQSPVDAEAAVAAIRDALIAVDPEGRSEYERNAADYLARLDRLDREISACIGEVPVAQRKLVTSHDALGPFADRYGIEIVGATIPALTTQAQPSAGETAELVDLIEAEGVEAVFPEVGVSASLEEAIASETGAEIGAALYADALGPADSPGATYLGALASNAAEMVDGFSGGEVGCEIEG